MEGVKTAKYGTREQVFNGLAQMTKGKLKKEDLTLCEKTGKYKSVRAVERGRALVQNLKKLAVEVPAVEVPVVEVPAVEVPQPVEIPKVDKPKRVRKKKVIE
jgi:hypothetical protein